ncbi:MAG: hypothetical protein JWM14_50 [Chitinophagaceae bacterium]|nr:hypothetical protein [Chitinophagaceae bacterium]
MNKYMAIVWFAAFTFLSAQAQTPSSGAAPIDPLKKGKGLLEQLVSSIDASTFLNSWTSQARAQWTSELTNATDAVTLAKCVSELSEYIKPGKFKQQFSLAQLKSLASGTKNYGDVANAMATFESGLASEAYSNDWVSKEPSWLSELKLVK